MDPRSSWQWLRCSGRRDRSRLPVIRHEHWTADSHFDHGHLHVRLPTCSGQLLSDGLSRFPAKFSCTNATTTSNRKRQSDRKRYNEKSPYQAPDRGYFSGAVRFDSHLSRWGKFNFGLLIVHFVRTCFPVQSFNHFVVKTLKNSLQLQMEASRLKLNGAWSDASLCQLARERREQLNGFQFWLAGFVIFLFLIGPWLWAKIYFKPLNVSF